MRYNPALDGLRAVAITFVLLAHSFSRVFPSGGIGVDIFFVLSGYLITSILTNEINQTGTISWGGFYWRRFLRLTPALLMLAAFQFAHAAVSPHNGPEIRESTVIALLYLQNWNMALQLGPADLIGHTWSLATEEQFYLLWPLLLPFISKRRPALIIGLAAIAMTFARFYLWKLGSSYDRIQFAPDVRPIGLLIGCGLAMIPSARWPRLSATVPFCLVAFLFALSVLVPDRLCWSFILAPLAASSATAVLIVALQSGGLFSKALSFAPAVYVGRISYGLYLYSAPIVVLVGVWKHYSGVYQLAAIGVSVAAAAASYEFVEKRFLRLKNRYGAKSLRLAAAAE
ncbi:MAG TPA: acyltransferase [Roseiarcus sp.]|nr:acyltransferase [Roseiarcus sp.]